VRPSASTLAQTFSACRSTGQMGSRPVGQGPPVNLQDYGQELEVEKDFEHLAFAV